MQVEKCFSKETFSNNILLHNNQFLIRTDQSSLFIMDFGVWSSSASYFSLCKYAKLSFSDTSYYCSPSTKIGVRHAEAPCSQPFPPIQAALVPASLSLCPVGCLHYWRSSTMGQGTSKAGVLWALTQHWPPTHVQTWEKPLCAAEKRMKGTILPAQQNKREEDKKSI